MMVKKLETTTDYAGLPGIYFRKLLDTIVSVGNLDRDGLTILDYGAGYGVLRRMLNARNAKVKVVNYDVVPELTDIDDWHDVNFDIVVANEVFCYLEASQLERLLTEFRQKNENAELIIGISKQSFVNNIGKVILGKWNAHILTKLKPKDELSVLSKYMEIISHKSVWYLADVYRFRFKTTPA
ncbi:uncharacterized protein METZ01_LOCUS373340 [marine metagenome]|jgi:hypothetical protein|uniref:Methyltransferase type 11 domain-containing protein n=1 Tax=marine metagenome TaxID=408172 RepID=A0A382TEL3_9ZZZZ|tara:strand:+ start:371 stop:919 length:549 start_codon:yes stop_codon:yes gene_type:complete